MRFYRLEKTNYIKEWAYAIFRAIAIGLLITIGIMLISGYKFMIVSSGSMEPTLPVGSLVIVTPCDYEELKEGDIVTMDAGGINLTHRIVGKYDSKEPQGFLAWEECTTQEEKDRYLAEEFWVTQGDNSDTVDGALTDNVVGKVYEGHAFTWVGTAVRYVRANYMMLIILLVLLGIFISVVDWLKSKLVLDDIECYEWDDED